MSDQLRWRASSDSTKVSSSGPKGAPGRSSARESTDSSCAAMPESTKISFGAAVARAQVAGPAGDPFDEEDFLQGLQISPDREPGQAHVESEAAVGVHDCSGPCGEQADQAPQLVLALNIGEPADVPIDERLHIGIVEASPSARVGAAHGLGQPAPDDPVGVLGARHVGLDTQVNAELESGVDEAVRGSVDLTLTERPQLDGLHPAVQGVRRGRQFTFASTVSRERRASGRRCTG
nr:hypothetical protein [Cryptosporangium phraense]